MGFSALLKSTIRLLLPRRQGTHQILSGPLRGRRIVTSWSDYPAAIAGYDESGVLKWFEDSISPGETWLDVGSHYGYTTLAIAQLTGERGRVFSFEPVTATAGSLVQTKELNNLTQVTVVPLALGAPETLELRQLATTRGMADSTLPPGKATASILVVSLDWLWPRIADGAMRIDGIKIDVQGMELEVLQGMRGLLGFMRPKLAIEMHKGVDRKALLELLADCGYAPDSRPLHLGGGETVSQYYDNRSYAFSAR